MIDSSSTPDLIILGASARAAAQSAIRAGYRPWCADLFADSDLRATVPVVRCARKDYPHGLLELLRSAPVRCNAAVLLTGALENHPDLIEAIAAIHPLLGNSAPAISMVRDPTALQRLPRHPGLRRCGVSRRRSPFAWLGRLTPRSRKTARYLLKPLCGTGGRSIRAWIPIQTIDRDHYLQRYVAGKPISAVYSGDGKQVRLVGVTEQIIGDAAFGAAGFQYCGSVGPIALTGRQEDALSHLGTALTRLFALRSVFGVDAVVDKAGQIWPLEVNPRYTASVEILEQAGCAAALLPLNVAKATQRSIIRGDRQTRDASPTTKTGATDTTIHAKAIAFARRDVPVGDLLQTFAPDQIADVPSPGELIDSGWPICTLLTHGTDPNTCVTRLRAMARRLDAHLVTRA